MSDDSEHNQVFYEMASRYYERLLEWTVRADREIITSNAYKKSQLACKYLKIDSPDSMKEIYDYVWCDEVTKCWDALHSKKEEAGKYWAYYKRAMQSKGWIFVRPHERPASTLDSEVREEFAEMFEERKKKGLIK